MTDEWKDAHAPRRGTRRRPSASQTSALTLDTTEEGAAATRRRGPGRRRWSETELGVRLPRKVTDSMVPALREPEHVHNAQTAQDYPP